MHTMEISRRKFVKISSLVSLTSIVPFSGCSVMNIGGLEGDISSLYKRFQSPLGAARPFVRWWWNGDRIDEKELLRKLDMLKEKSISGVEINPMAFSKGNNPMNYKAFTWLSDDWIKMLNTVLDGAKVRYMACSIIVGSGWPFGGEFLTKSE